MEKMKATSHKDLFKVKWLAKACNVSIKGAILRGFSFEFDEIRQNSTVQITFRI